MIHLSKPWARQPQSGFTPNYGHPIARGLDFLVVGSDLGQSNLVTGALGAKASDIVIGVQAPGVSVSASGGGTRAVAWPGVIQNGAGEFTLLSFSAPAYDATPVVMLSHGTGGGAYGMLSINMNNAYGGSVGNLRIWANDGTTRGGTSVGSDGLPHVYIGTRSSSEMLVYRDGSLVESGAGSTTNIGTVTSSQIYSSGIYGYGGYAGACPHYLQAIWSRALTMSECEELGRNPWMLFRSREMYIPSPTGASAPTLVSANAINIAATAARARVSFTR